jgi:hypothetical protein
MCSRLLEAEGEENCPLVTYLVIQVFLAESPSSRLAHVNTVVTKAAQALNLRSHKFFQASSRAVVGMPQYSSGQDSESNCRHSSSTKCVIGPRRV